MIYKDSQAHLDQEFRPAQRLKELCRNCGRHAANHAGWSCELGARKDFSQVSEDKRYCTNSMALSVLSKPAHPITTWQGWAADFHNPDYCKCGIFRSQCEYHR